MSLAGAIERMTRKLRRQIDSLVSRVRIDSVDDSTGVQEVQVEALKGEVLRGERFQQYGFTSVPPADSEGVAVYPIGNRDHCLVVAEDDRATRLTGLLEGESAIYDKHGQRVRLHQDGTLELVGTVKIQASAPLIELIATNEVRGGALGTVFKVVIELFIALYNVHTHGGGPPPDQQAAVDTHTTTTLKGN